MSLRRINKKAQEWILPRGQLTSPSSGQQTTSGSGQHGKKVVVNQPHTKESKETIKEKNKASPVSLDNKDVYKVKEPFPPPTQQQKEEIGLLHATLIKKHFNIHTFVSRVNKAEGYFPPWDSIIKIAHSAIKTQPINLWGYFTKALQSEFPKAFAELNIQEHQQLKQDLTNSKIGNIMQQLYKGGE